MASLNLSSKISLSLITGAVGTGIITSSVLINKNNLSVSEDDNPSRIKQKVIYDSKDKEERNTKKLDEAPNFLLNNSEIQEDISTLKEQTQRKELSERMDINVGLEKDTIKNQDQNELSNLKKHIQYDLEIKEKNISLEGVWMSGEGSYCFLLKNNSDKSVPNIMTESDENSKTCEDDDFEFETTWSDHKTLMNNQEGLWIRGDSSKVRELFRENENDLLKQSGFVNKDKNVSSDTFEDMMNSSICKLNKKNNTNWIEISCLIPKSK